MGAFFSWLSSLSLFLGSQIDTNKSKVKEEARKMYPLHFWSLELGFIQVVCGEVSIIMSPVL